MKKQKSKVEEIVDEIIEEYMRVELESKEDEFDIENFSRVINLAIQKTAEQIFKDMQRWSEKDDVWELVNPCKVDLYIVEERKKYRVGEK